MHQADIKALIEKKGARLSQIDELNGFPLGTCSDAFRNKRPKAERAIADFLNFPPYKLFPTRYRKDGTRIDERKLSDKLETNTKPDNRKSVEVAGAA